MRSRTELVIRGLLAFAFLVWISSLSDEAWSWLGPLFFLRFDIAVFIGGVGGGLIFILLPLPWQFDSSVQDASTAQPAANGEPRTIRPVFRGLAYVLGPLMIVFGIVGTVGAATRVLDGTWVAREHGLFAFSAVGSIIMGVVFLRAAVTGEDPLS